MAALAECARTFKVPIVDQPIALNPDWRKWLLCVGQFCRLPVSPFVFPSLARFRVATMPPNTYRKFGLGSGCGFQGYGVAESFQAMHVLALEAVGFESFEEVAAQVGIAGCPARYVVEDHQDGMSHSHQSAPLVAPSGQASILRRW